MAALRRWAPSLGIFLVAAGIGLLFSRQWPESYDGVIMFHVAENMIRDHSLKILPQQDHFGLNTPYSSYGLGLSILMVPFYLLAPVLRVTPNAAVMNTNGVLFALTVCAIYWLCRISRATAPQAVITAFVVGLGTLLLAYTQTLFSEIGVALGVALGLVSIVAAGEEKDWAPWVGGLGCGLAISLRSDSLLLVFPAIAAGFWLETPKSNRIVSSARFAFAALPFALGLAAYNHLRFGAPWRMGYARQQGFVLPLLPNALHELISPGRGVLVYVPLLFVALAGTLMLWKHDKVIPLVALALVAFRILLYGKWHAWHGGVGFGPRFMVPAMPALAFGVLEIARRFATFRAWQRAAVGSMAFVSIAVQVAGSFTGYEYYWNRITRLPGGVDLYFFDWRYLPIVGQAQMLIHWDGIVSAALQPGAGPGRLIVVAFAIAIGTALVAWGLSAVPQAVEPEAL